MKSTAHLYLEIIFVLRMVRPQTCLGRAKYWLLPDDYGLKETEIGK
jgi:hypothetical protein